MDQDQPIKTFDGELYNKEKAVQFNREMLQKRSIQGKLLYRDDCMELVETCPMLLGETPPKFQLEKAWCCS